MTSAELLAGLRMAQELLTALVEDLDEATWRVRYHPDLDAAGWYLGHCVWTECHWLQEVATGDDRFTAPVAKSITLT